MKIKILIISVLFLVFLSSCGEEKKETEVIKITNSTIENTNSDFLLKEKFREALKNFKNKNYKKTISILEEYIKKNNNDEKAYYYIGVSYRFLGNIEKSIEYLEKSLKINPKYILAWYNLGIFYKKEGIKEKQKICEIVWKTLEGKKITTKLNIKQKNIINLIKNKDNFLKEVSKILDK